MTGALPAASPRGEANSEGGERATAARFTRSALVGGSEPQPGAGFHQWWARRHLEGRFQVTPVPFAELDRWRFDPDTGNLGHESGRFFTVEGLRVADGSRTWSQPIINQPEIGVLGILVKEFNGVLHCLMQAKMEPGNVNTLQLSPTVQATRSNYTRIHQGGSTRYIEHFRGPGRGRVLVDSLQSEQGSWFWHKHNRNMVVEAVADVPDDDDFRWLTLRQIRALLHTENLVNMDARTVLACMAFERPDAAGADPFADALLRSYPAADGSPDTGALHSSAEILSWFTEAKTRCEWHARLVPLAGIAGWSRTEDDIGDDTGREFRIMGARVVAGNREVTSWAQPLLAPRGQGLAAFVVRPIAGVLHLLVRARPEPGLRDLVEMAPTVQLASGATEGGPFADMVGDDTPGRIRFDTVMSEEGGRFHHAQTRYRVVEVGDDFPVEVPEEYRWMTAAQLLGLLRHGHYLNVEARSLLACVHSLW